VEPATDTPVIKIGGAPSARRAPFNVCAVFAAWGDGIVPTPNAAAPMLAPMLAATRGGSVALGSCACL
jgi:hypothetical protein